MSEDPRKTLTLLDQLEPLGFDDKAFGWLHHHREAPGGGVWNRFSRTETT